MRGLESAQLCIKEALQLKGLENQNYSGAINLTPPVSRILASLGLLAAAKEIAFETEEIGIFSLRSGAKLGAIPFADAETGYTSLRIERGPPGGEGAALAMEDAVVLGRLVGKAEEEGADVEAAFRRYDELRRERKMENYTRASARWEGAKNCSWLFQQTMEFFMWAFLMVSWNKREWGFGYDASNVELGGKLA
ncbi:hypothetical protein VF21_03612 [Pseudogymnoascus sp. 05NY08]|nr:hypothetical protein VF21_03612 [Pseudogymnoascus sp. 05NY08]